jgi:hypothetical protein
VTAHGTDYDALIGKLDLQRKVALLTGASTVRPACAD